MKVFGGLFGDSEFRPLYEHYLKIAEGARKLPVFLKEYALGHYSEADAYASWIAKLEEEADLIKDETRKHISTSIFAAVRRGDIMLYLSTQDDIADEYTTVVSILTKRRTLVPAELEKHLFDLCDKCLKVVAILGDILETAPEQGNQSRLDDLSVAIARSEHSAADSCDSFLRELFAQEHSMDPVSVILYIRISEHIVKMAKQARNSADILQRLRT